MQRILHFAVLSLLPVLANAASPLDGTWKVLPETYKTFGQPDEYDVTAGQYRCISCVPVLSVKADGADHPVTGHDYYDSVAAQILNDHSVTVVRKKAGKTINKLTDTVSADGATLTSTWVDYTGAQGAEGTSVSKRVGPAPSGANAVSGKWQSDSMGAASDSMLTVKYRVTDTSAMADWNGQVYEAHFDGKEYPVKNDPGNTTVTLHRFGADTIEEIDHRGGKVVDVVIINASPDGRTLRYTDSDLVHHQTTLYTLAKQP